MVGWVLCGCFAAMVAYLAFFILHVLLGTSYSGVVAAVLFVYTWYFLRRSFFDHTVYYYQGHCGYREDGLLTKWMKYRKRRQEEEAEFRSLDPSLQELHQRILRIPAESWQCACDNLDTHFRDILVVARTEKGAAVSVRSRTFVGDMDNHSPVYTISIDDKVVHTESTGCFGRLYGQVSREAVAEFNKKRAEDKAREAEERERMEQQQKQRAMSDLKKTMDDKF